MTPPFGADSTLARALTMRAVGLPCPEPLAFIRARGPGWTARGATPDDAAGWASVLASDLMPPAIAMRPAGRTFGTRLAALTRVEDVLVDQYGAAFTPLELAELLLAARWESGWIVEARAQDHPLLAGLLPGVRPMPALVALTLLG
ncbi:MAG TPA: hypothetical protein VL422_09225, partial [Miltoncostaea sp.]|nr:hypothetical protein [Miltoncostaea sp.]